MRKIVIALAFILAVSPLSAFAAIAYDNAAFTAFGAAPQSISFTVANLPNRILIACIGTLNDTATAPTYNGVSFTDSGLKSTYIGSGRFGHHLYYLVAPATGANTFTSNSSAGSTEASVASYNGVRQTSPIDVSNIVNQSSSASLTTTMTTTIANAWITQCEVDSGAGSGPSFTAGTATTLRISDTSFAGSVVDSGGARAAGSNSVSVNMLGSVAPSLSSGIGVALAPAVPAFQPWMMYGF